MQLSPTPDLSSGWRSVFVALLAAALMAMSALLGSDASTTPFADTDATLRLVEVRDLVAGTPWFDTHIERLQPPLGLESHWSRLVDGAMAVIAAPATWIAGPAVADRVLWTAWPLLMLLPLALGCVLAARSMAGSAGVLFCLFPLTAAIGLVHFRIGNVDHHNVQIALFMLALAGTLSLERRWGPLLAGAATGLLLAIGLEALVLAAVLGASIALRAFAGHVPRRAARNYAVALALSLLAAFLAQTAPANWTVTACDMLAFNLLGALLICCAVLALAGSLTLSRSWPRFAVLAAGALLAGGVYLGLDPQCAAGPFGGMDPALRPIWLDHVREVQRLDQLFAKRPTDAILVAVPMLVAVLATGAILLRGGWRDPRWLTLAALLLMASASGLLMVRMLAYTLVLAIVVLASALPKLLPRRISGTLLGGVAASAVLSPLAAILLVLAVTGQSADGAAKAKEGLASCQQPGALAGLASLPKGTVLADIDMGPALLAQTPHSALAAPYHRMAYGIVSAHNAWAAPAAEAAATLQRLGVGYVILCRSARRNGLPFADNSLRRALEAGEPVPGLDPVPAGAALDAWTVRPGP